MSGDNWMRDMHPNLPCDGWLERSDTPRLLDGWLERSDVPRLLGIVILGLLIGLVGGIDWSQPVVFLP
jgi:hypothetical protein